MNKEREIDGIKIVVNGEQYEAYKGTLQDEIKKQNKYIEMLQNNIEKLVEENGEKARRINKAIEYIETLEKQEAFKIEDNENGVPELKVDNEEYLVFCKYNKLLNILKGNDKE